MAKKEEQPKPEWDVATKGAVPEGHGDLYTVTDSSQAGQEPPKDAEKK